MIERRRITDRTGIEWLDSRLHDETLELDGVARDEQRGRVRIPLVVADYAEERTLSRVLGRRRVAAPLRSGVLLVDRVRTVTVDDRARIGRYMIMDIAVDESGTELVVTAAENMEIVIAIDAIDVALEVDGGSNAGTQERRIYPGGIETIRRTHAADAAAAVRPL